MIIASWLFFYMDEICIKMSALAFTTIDIRFGAGLVDRRWIDMAEEIDVGLIIDYG